MIHNGVLFSFSSCFSASDAFSQLSFASLVQEGASEEDPIENDSQEAQPLTHEEKVGVFVVFVVFACDFV